MWVKPQPHLSARPGRTAKISWLLAFVFSNTFAVQILHEPEEGQFVEEDLGDLHQEVFSTVLQSPPLELTEGVLERQKKFFDWLETKSLWLETKRLSGSYLKDTSKLFVEKLNKFSAFIVLLDEIKDQAPHQRQQLEGTNLMHVLL